MRPLMKVLIVALGCLFLAQAAEAYIALLTVKNKLTDVNKHVFSIKYYDSHGVLLGIEYLDLVIKPGWAELITIKYPGATWVISEEYRGIPPSTLSRGSETLFPGPTSGSITYSSYYDGTLDTLYIGYDDRGPEYPIFCASPLDINPVTGECVCLDSTPTQPIEGALITILVEGETIPIPTLTEWGMIIFSVLLFGWMAWVIVRRRKRITAGVTVRT